MDSFTIRAILAGIILIILVQQARHATAGSHRRRAFVLAAGGLSVFLLIHLSLAMGIAVGPLITPLVAPAIGLLAAGLLFLVLAWRRGEMREQVERMREALVTERTRREQEVEEK